MKNKLCKLLKRICAAVLIGSTIAMTAPCAGSNVNAASTAQNMPAGFVRGVDISSIIAFEQSGVAFKYEDGTQADIFDILKDAGVNYVRIRVWNDPYDSTTGKGYGGGNCDLYKAVEIGKRATEHGMLCMIDFQYSDFWADPAKQYPPKEWINYTASQKADAIYYYTYNSLKTLIDSGVRVGMVQIGNETQGSMCGMGGLYGETYNLTSGVGAAIQKGCDAVDAVSAEYGLTGDDKILKVLHFTDPNTTASWYAECLEDLNVNYDVFSVSAYPFWHGDPAEVGESLKYIARTFNKKVMVAETSYPYTFDNADSSGNNIGSLNDMSFSGYSISPAGQKQAIIAVMNAVASVNAQSGTYGYGLGAFYWEPAWIGTTEAACSSYGTGFASSASGNYELLFKSTVSEYSATDRTSSWDNMALFASDGTALSSLQLFKEVGVTSYDKTEISNLINSTYSLNQNNYSTENWNKLNSAVSWAVYVRDNNFATKLDIEYATKYLRNMINQSNNGTYREYNFSDSQFNSLGQLSANTTVGDLQLKASADKTMEVTSSWNQYNGYAYTHCLALSGSGSTSSRSVAIPVNGNCTITVIGKSSGWETRTLILADSNGNQLTTMSEGTTLTGRSYSYSGGAGNLYLYSANSGISIYNIQIQY